MRCQARTAPPVFTTPPLLRGTIRAQKAALTAGNAAPSEASIEERIRTRERIQNLKRLVEESQEAIDALHSLSGRWKSLQTELADQRKGYLSDSDEKKLQSLQTSFAQQASDHGLSSVPTTSLTVSRET